MTTSKNDRDELVACVQCIDSLMPNSLEPLRLVLPAKTMGYIDAAVSVGILHRCPETNRYFAVNPAFKAQRRAA